LRIADVAVRRGDADESGVGRDRIIDDFLLTGSQFKFYARYQRGRQRRFLLVIQHKEIGALEPRIVFQLVYADYDRRGPVLRIGIHIRARREIQFEIDRLRLRRRRTAGNERRTARP
jgi:hypothetical protein